MPVFHGAPVLQGRDAESYSTCSPVLQGRVTESRVQLPHYRDVFHPCAALADYADGSIGGGGRGGSGLMRALALHALQHALVVTRERLRHAKKKLESPDGGFTRPTVWCSMA